MSLASFTGNIIDTATPGTDYHAPALTDTGSANTILVTATPAPTAYTTGMILSVKVLAANTGATTISVNGLVAKTLKKSVTSDLALGDLVAGQIVSLIYDGTNFQVIGLSSSGGGGGKAIYSNGADGNVTVAVNTTLTRDMYYDRLTVNAGVTLTTAGYRVFCKTSCTNNGTIDNSASGPNGGLPNGNAACSLGGGTNNGASSYMSYWKLFGGIGGGGVGDGTFSSGKIGNTYAIHPSLMGYCTYNDYSPSTNTRLVAIGGGTGGANGTAATGGGGGGVVLIYAPTISGTGTISAKGGNGATETGANANSSGGGGGVVIVLCDSGITTCTISVAGGNAGTGGSGTAGIVGAAGRSFVLNNT